MRVAVRITVTVRHGGTASRAYVVSVSLSQGPTWSMFLSVALAESSFIFGVRVTEYRSRTLTLIRVTE